MPDGDRRTVNHRGFAAEEWLGIPQMGSDDHSGGPSRLERLSDEELLGLVRGADRRPFEALYDRHSVAAFSLACRIVGSRDLAEDVVQEAFLGLWRDSRRYEPELGAVRTWLMSIVRHRSVDALRRLSARQRMQTVVAAFSVEGSPTDLTSADVCARDEGQTIRAVMEGLPEEQRRVIELAFYGGLTQTEIAETLRVPLGTVKGRARLGLLKLRTLLDEAQAR